jgi:hypothetical protein
MIISPDDRYAPIRPPVEHDRGNREAGAAATEGVGAAECGSAAGSRAVGAEKAGLHAPAAPVSGAVDLGRSQPAHVGHQAEHEREVLRDWRQIAASLRSRARRRLAASVAPIQRFLIIEWSANPLVALFMAVESLGGDDGRVWVLNPWIMNEHTADLLFVPPADSAYFKPYAIKLDALDAPALPEAAPPMAFRPVRSSRAYNAQNIFWTVHGKDATPLDKLVFL